MYLKSRMNFQKLGHYCGSQNRYNWHVLTANMATPFPEFHFSNYGKDVLG